jgi:hypothetical protein
LATACSSAADPATAPGGASTEPSGPVALVSNQVKPWTIALDAANVYWLNEGTLGGVYKVSKAGGPITTLYQGSLGAIESLGLDATSIYVPLDDSIIAIPLAGGAPRTVVSNATTRGVAVANGNIYWVPQVAPQTELTVQKASVSGGAVLAIHLPSDVPSRGGGAYFTRAGADAIYITLSGGGGIVRVPLDESSPHWFGLSDVRDVGFDATSIYFTTGDTVSRTAKDGGGTASNLATAASPFGIVAADGFLYFTDARPAGRVLRIASGGGDVSVLAKDQATPHSVAVDDTSVYWNCIDDGTIKKIAK